MKNLEIEKLNSKDPEIDDSAKKLEFSEKDSRIDLTKYRGKIIPSKIDGSDFGSLEGMSNERDNIDNASSEDNNSLKNAIFKIDQNLGVDNNTSNPIAFEKRSVQTESIKEEKISVQQDQKSEDFVEIKKKKYDRYFDDVSTIKCFKCGKVGHTRNTCLDQTKVS